MDRADVLIIGAGRNGLVCACDLAAAGLRVHVLERRPVVGGAAFTEEFCPGFRNSTAIYAVSLLKQKVIRDLRLIERGMGIVEMLIPSVADDSLAPAGAHVASLFCPQFKPDADWDTLKPCAIESIFSVVEQHCPNFRRALLGDRASSPLDLERDFGLIGGDIFHGQLSLEQLFSMRPLLGYARYRGPLAGPYRCGAGAHPGGGVTGAPGHNAAVEMVRDLV